MMFNRKQVSKWFMGARLVGAVVAAMIMTSCYGAGVSIYRSYPQATMPLQDVAMVVTNKNLGDYFVKFTHINKNGIHHPFYVMEPGIYQFTIQVINKNRYGGGPTLYYAPSVAYPNVPTVIPFGDGKTKEGPPNKGEMYFKAGYVYYLEAKLHPELRFITKIVEIHHSQVNESHNPLLAKQYQFVKEYLPEAAYKEGMGPFPIKP